MAMSKVIPSCVPLTWTLWCDIIGGKKSLTSTWSELEPGPIISQGYIVDSDSNFLRMLQNGIKYYISGLL